MSIDMIWLLVFAAITVFLYVDLSMARSAYRASRSRGHEWRPFLRWWLQKSVAKLLISGGALVIVGLALFLQGNGLVIPEFLNRISLSRKTQWALGAGLCLTAFILFDLFMAWRYYHGKSGKTTTGVRFYRWWLGKSYKKFTVMGILAGLVLGGAYAAHRYNFLQFKGETSGYLASAQRYYEAKKFREATLELRNAIKQNPGDHESYLWLARSYWQLGNLPEARDAYREAVKIEPNLYAAHLELSRVAYALKDPETTQKAAQQALALSPAAAEPRQTLALLYSATGKKDKALEQCRAILNAKFATPENREQLITLLLYLGASTEALQAATYGLHAAPNDLPLKYLQIKALIELDRSAEAETELRKVANLTASPDPYLTLGDIRMRRGEYLPALQEYEEALKRDPKNERAMNNVASLNAEHGFDMNKSAPLAALMYARHPKDPAVADTLGWTLFRQGKLKQALPLLRRGVARMPDNPQVHYHLGAALLKNGNQAAGKKELVAALKISGNFDGAARARELLKS